MLSDASPLDLSVVIPVYRSALTLRELTQRLLAVLDATQMSYEILFVEDGSPDDSWSILREVQQERPEQIVCIQLMRNYGQHNALMCGFRQSRGRYVITMDDDLQNPPEEIPVLLQAMEAGNYDLMYGRYEHKAHEGWRNLSSSVVNAFYRAVFGSSHRVTSFRIIRRPVVDSILVYSLNFTFIDGLLAWNTQRIGEVTVRHCPRPQGRSGYSFGKLMVLALNLFTNFSLLPLQIVSAFGLLSASAGFLLTIYYLIRYFTSQIDLPGYASLIVTILFLGGVQLLALGVIGEYLGRLHLNVNRKPQYVERQVLGGRAQRNERERGLSLPLPEETKKQPLAA
jgi:polyisoprenyl-phosphate glycosyltransferase